MIKFSNKYLLYFFSILLVNHSFVYAEEIDLLVYCANKDRKWKWLKYPNSQNYYIKGEKKTIYNSYEDEIMSFEYFNISGKDAENKINDLKQKCINSFGKEFEFPQPARTRFSEWIPFGIDSYKLSKGFFTINSVERHTLYNVEVFSELHLNLNENVQINYIQENLNNIN
ncbi:hypothetical protein GCL60_03435 [Silvanigrella paludirubra]|uniref:Uncharacterized protein n=1 Tax=Silvanigrella paludirubra TaxID=2499159 RepID=A0A6N6VY53_9BACT|nr:hypothetical protein [Silvanigrella paludirubra]KAB8040999.1 hypothetical protein GCL60_03435 [Silvanigrella paludirubra]